MLLKLTLAYWLVFAHLFSISQTSTHVFINNFWYDPHEVKLESLRCPHVDKWGSWQNCDGHAKDNINKKWLDGFIEYLLSAEELSTISPSVMFVESCVLLSAIEYMIFLHQQRKKQEEELEALRKEVMALKIMKA